MPANKRFLVVVRAGDRSLHPQWTSALAARDWDLAVSYYGDDPERFRDEGEARIDDPGLKWQGLHALLTRETFWRGYEYVWLPDDDLAADQATISAFFAEVAELELSLAQPALTWDSYYSHLMTLRHPSFRARWTDFIEIMAPASRSPFSTPASRPSAKRSAAGGSIGCGRASWARIPGAAPSSTRPPSPTHAPWAVPATASWRSSVSTPRTKASP
jgi:hypothetical protein